MASILQISEFEFRQQYVTKENGYELIASPTVNHNCLLDCNNHCKVYNARPESCKTYPNWDAIWQSEESVLNETKLCKGLKLAVEKFLKIKEETN